MDLLRRDAQDHRAVTQMQARAQLRLGGRLDEIVASGGQRHDIDALPRNAQVALHVRSAGLGQRDQTVCSACDRRHEDSPEPRRRRLARVWRDDPGDVCERHDVHRPGAKGSGHRDAVEQVNASARNQAEQAHLADRLRAGASQQGVRDQLHFTRPLFLAQVLMSACAAEHAEPDAGSELQHLRNECAHVRVKPAHARLEEQGVEADVGGEFGRQSRGLFVRRPSSSSGGPELLSACESSAR